MVMSLVKLQVEC